MKHIRSIGGKIAFALGKGILAGIAGTAAISIAQLIEMNITGREPSDAPAKAVNKVLHVQATDEQHKETFVDEVHWTYGTLWGLARSVLEGIGLKGIPATAVHFAALWGTEMVMLPSLHVSEPVSKWGANAIAKDGVNHLTYAVAAGLAYDAIQ